MNQEALKSREDFSSNADYLAHLLATAAWTKCNGNYIDYWEFNPEEDEQLQIEVGECFYYIDLGAIDDMEESKGTISMIDENGTDIVLSFSPYAEKPASVWLTVIEHRRGTNYYTSSSKELADEIVYAYVLTWWLEEMDHPIPDDKAQAISDYFSSTGMDESYLVFEETVLTDVNKAFAIASSDGDRDALLLDAKDPRNYEKVTEDTVDGSFDTILPDLGMYLKESLPKLETPQDLFDSYTVTYEFLGDLRRLGKEPNGDMTEFMFRAKRTIQDCTDGGTDSKENDVRICIYLEDDEEQSLKTPISSMLDWDSLQAQLELYLAGD